MEDAEMENRTRAEWTWPILRRSGAEKAWWQLQCENPTPELMAVCLLFK